MRAPDQEPTRAVLHTVRLIGVASIERLVERLDRDVAELEHCLARCEADGLVRFVDRGLAGWQLTEEGRRWGGELLAAELRASGAADRVEAVYGEFIVLNPVFLELCTDWQLLPVGTASSERVRNDHSDPDYDAEVIERLHRVHEDIIGVIEQLEVVLERFSPYRYRLTHALERVRGGDGDWFTRPVLDSYHTVWFELHEDLLATLGRERSSERRSP